jgi:MFS family permease
MPIVVLLYFFAFLDRSNIGNAKVAGFQKDLGISAKQYSIALTSFYVAYIVIEIPSNLIMKKVGPNRLLPTLAILWGLVTMCQGAVRNYSSLIACRVFLGIFEGGLTPGLMLYMSHFYRREDLQLRVSMLFAATSLAGAFSGLLAAAIAKLNGLGGHHGWEFIFYFEGAASVLLGIVCYFIMPNQPSHIRLIPKDELATYVSALRADWSSDENVGPFSWEEFRRAFKDPQLWLLTPSVFANGATFYGLAFFMAPVVNSLGYSPNRTQLMTVPPFAVSAVFSLAVAYLADKHKQRGFPGAFVSLFAVVGYIMFYTTKDRGISYAALFFQACGAYGLAPANSAWIANNSLPYYKRATVIAWGFTISSSGGILSTWLFNDPPRYLKGNKVNLGLSIIMVLSPLANRLYLKRQNKKKAAVIASGNFDDSHEARVKMGDAHPRFKYYL